MELKCARKKIKAKRHLFEVRKRRLAIKTMKKFTEVDFFTENTHDFLVVISKYFEKKRKIQNFAVCLKWEKEVLRAVGYL